MGKILTFRKRGIPDKSDSGRHCLREVLEKLRRLGDKPLPKVALHDGQLHALVEPVTRGTNTIYTEDKKAPGSRPKLGTEIIEEDEGKTYVYRVPKPVGLVITPPEVVDLEVKGDKVVVTPKEPISQEKE